MRAAFLLIPFVTCVAATKTASVEGNVVDAMSGAPVRKAPVVLEIRPGFDIRYSTTTDAEGRFTIFGMRPGEYAPMVERSGYVQRRDAQKSLTVAPAEALKNLTIRMTPCGVITGRVLDADGDPIVNASVTGFTVRYMNGKRMVNGGGGAQTNDRGEYRMFGLEPGRYLVAARFRKSTPEGTQDGFAFHPAGVNDATATALNVAAGAELSAVDIVVGSRKGVRVSGRVTLPSDRPARLNMWSPDLSLVFGTTFVLTTPKGEFTFDGVIPGKYVISSEYDTDDKRKLLLSADVEIGEEGINNLLLAFRSAVSITGKVVIEGRNRPPRKMPILTTTNRGGGHAETDDNGHFTIKDQWPGPCHFAINQRLDDYYVKAILAGTQESPDEWVDVSQGPEVTIVLARDVATVQGSVTTADNKPPAFANVVLLPVERPRPSRYAMVNTDQNGRYSIKGVAPGKYTLYAFDKMDWGEWNEPDFAQKYEKRGVSLDIGSSAHESRDLSLILTEEAQK